MLVTSEINYLKNQFNTDTTIIVVETKSKERAVTKRGKQLFNTFSDFARD